jgi:flagellar export protein FliJ
MRGLTGLLRARKAQEDIARGRTQRARAEAAAAAERVRRYEEAINLRKLPEGVDAGAYVATLSAHRAMAEALAASRNLAAQADGAVADAAAELTDAAVRRRAVERLAERQAAEARKAADAAERREIDDLTTAAHTRNRGEIDR